MPLTDMSACPKTYFNRSHYTNSMQIYSVFGYCLSCCKRFRLCTFIILSLWQLPTMSRSIKCRITNFCFVYFKFKKLFIALSFLFHSSIEVTLIGVRRNHQIHQSLLCKVWSGNFKILVRCQTSVKYFVIIIILKVWYI